MNDKKRLNSYEDLPLVLDVADIQRIMGISRADRKSTRLNSSHASKSRMPSSA